jgi:hypothetical protein
MLIIKYGRTDSAFHTGTFYIRSTGDKKIPAGVMTTLVRFRGNLDYQVDYRAAIGGKCDAPDLLYYTD